MKYVLIIIGAYFLGSIPWAYIIAKQSKGIDIRRYGSGNVGFTNTLRTCGKKQAFLVLAGDVGKGIAAVMIAKHFGSPPLAALSGLTVVTGHNYSVFLGFKGGKGAAAGIGALFAMVPIVSILALAIWGVTIAVSRYVSLGTIIGAISVPIACIVLRVDLSYTLFGFIAASFVIAKHHSNISRLLKGTENKIGHRAE